MINMGSAVVQPCMPLGTFLVTMWKTGIILLAGAPARAAYLRGLYGFVINTGLLFLRRIY